MFEQREKLKVLLEELKAKGLKSIDVDVDEAKIAEANDNAEAAYAELCRLLEGINNGDGTKLVFKDSQKKITG